MNFSVRNCLTTGIALAGAGVIAVTPSVVPPPNIVTAAPALSSAQVELSAAVNPITAWVEVVQGAVTNLGGLGTALLEDPFPLLRQAIENVFSYGATVFNSVDSAIRGAVEFLSFDNEFGLWQQLGNAVTQAFQGEIAAAFNSLTDAVVNGPIFNIAFPLITTGLLDIPVKIVQNAANIVKTVFSMETLLPVTLGVIAPVSAFLAATGESLQTAFDSLVGGNLIDAAMALINMPAVLTGAVLNGYTKFDETWLPGVFSFSDEPFQGGLLQALLVTLPRAIAAAITPTPTPTEETTPTEDEAPPLVSARQAKLAAEQATDTDADTAQTPAADSAGATPVTDETPSEPAETSTETDETPTEPADATPVTDETPTEPANGGETVPTEESGTDESPVLETGDGDATEASDPKESAGSGGDRSEAKRAAERRPARAA